MQYSIRTAVWLAIALLAMPASPARAQGPRVEFTPFAGYRVGGKFELEDPEGHRICIAEVLTDTTGFPRAVD